MRVGEGVGRPCDTHCGSWERPIDGGPHVPACSTVGGGGSEYAWELLHDLLDCTPDNLRHVAWDRNPFWPDTEVVVHVGNDTGRESLLQECAKLTECRRTGQWIPIGVMIFPSRSSVLIPTATFLVVFGLHGVGSRSLGISGKMIRKQVNHRSSSGISRFLFLRSRSCDWVM